MSGNKLFVRWGIVVLLLGGVCQSVYAMPRNGLSFGLGIGGMVAEDENAYMGIGEDVYPEVQMAYDISGFKVGLSAGFLYRKEEVHSYRYGNRYSYNYEDFQQSFIPVELTFSVFPVRFVKPDFLFQPYLGLGVGSFIASGDNEDSFGMVSPRLGAEFQIGHRNVIGLDASYHFVDGESDFGGYFGKEDASLNYFTLMVVYRVRIPFEKIP